MKSVVIYFSQTGNTEKIGNAIAAGIAEATGQCESSRSEKSARWP